MSLLFLVAAFIFVPLSLFAAVCLGFGCGLLRLRLGLLLLLPLLTLLIVGLLLLLTLIALRLLRVCLGLFRGLGLCLLCYRCALLLLLGLFVRAAVMRTVSLTALGRACFGSCIVFLVVFHDISSSLFIKVCLP